MAFQKIILDTDTASTSVKGIVEIAIASEVNTGTSAVLAVSPDSLAGSEYGERAVQIVVYDWTTEVATGDGQYYFHIDGRLGGMDLVDVHAEVIDAGTTGNLDIQIHNLTQTADMLSTVMRIETGETGTDTSAQPGTIDGDNDDVAENDIIRIDIDDVQSTAPKGLFITMGFRLP